MTCLGELTSYAASFEVSNLSDAGAGSLREAVLAANGAAGADTITFAPGLTGTIALTTGQLTISDSLTIVGPGSGLLVVDGGGTSRVFDVLTPPTPGDPVALSGLTIANGAADDGGGIRIADADVVLDDVALTGNSASDDGGGLHADGFNMALTVTNSTISGNTTVDSGGGVYIEDTGSTVLFDSVEIDGNTAGNEGGGIYLYDPDADVVIDNSVITDNAVTNPTSGKGGGVYLYSFDSGGLTISDSTISGNRATFGGGIYLYDVDRPSSISGSTIANNQATDGAGIHVDSAFGRLEISSSTISGNTATGTGGGLFIDSGDGLVISHSTITDNSALADGGAHLGGGTSVTHSIIAGNSASNLSDPADIHAIDVAPGLTVAFNVIGDVDATTLTDEGGNQLNVADPMLAPLANNGGSTDTHLPLATSPAIDAGNPAFAAPPTTDQRGLPRVDGLIDIGAVEVQRGTIEFELAATPAAENIGTLIVNVVRSGVPDLPASVNVSSSDGTAIAPGDYGSISMAVTWASGEAGAKQVSIPIVLDAAHESDEGFTASLSAPIGASLGSKTLLAVTVQNSNSAPTLVDLPNISTQLGTALPALAATIGDAEQPVDALTVTAVSSNQAVVANSGITVGGAGAARTLSISPLAVGDAMITVTVSDGVLTATDTFTVTATASPVVAAPVSAVVDGKPLDGRVVRSASGSPTVSGAGHPGAGISLHVLGALPTTAASMPGLLMCSTTVAADGTWSCPISPALPVGTYTVTVGQTFGDAFVVGNAFTLAVSSEIELPATGGNSGLLSLCATTLLGLGAAMRAGARRRRPA